MKLLMKLFSIFCWHKYKFKSNIHPEISDVNGIGSVEECIRCGKLKLINESLSDQGLVIHYEINENGHGYYMFPVEWPMDGKESGNVCYWSLSPSNVEVLRWAFDSLISWKLNHLNEINK